MEDNTTAVDSALMESLLNEVNNHFNTASIDNNIENDTQSNESQQPTNIVNTPKIISESSSRFSGALWYNEAENHSITIGGCGGIGSWVAFAIARLGTAITIFDPDRVEAANMSGQLFSKNNIGTYKGSVLSDLAVKYSDNYKIYAYSRRIEPRDITPITICAFDNMEARKLCFEAWYTKMIYSDHKENFLFIDGRLSMEDMQVFCIHGKDIKNITRYRNQFLFSDKEAEAPLCSAKQTTHCAMMIGSLITGLYINFCYNRASEDKLFLRPLPFLTMYSAVFNNMTVEY